MKLLKRLVPWLLLALFVGELLAMMFPRQQTGFHYRDFGRLPVLLNGRVQPFDSVARNALLQIRGTASVPLEEKKWFEFWKHPRKLRATEWLLEVMLKPEVADTRPTFLIHHPELLGELKLENLGIEKSGLRYYSFDEIRGVAAEIGEQGQRAGRVDAQLRTSFQKEALKLAQGVLLYHRLKNSLRPEDATDFAAEIAAYQAAIKPGLEAARARETGQPHDERALAALARTFKRYDELSQRAYPLIVPPLHPETHPDEWANAGTALMEAVQHGEIPPAMQFFARLANAYRQDDSGAFNQALAAYEQWLAPKFAREIRKGRAEFFFHQVQFFLRATSTYIFAFLLAAGALLTVTLAPGLAETLRRSACYLVAFAFLVHTAGLIFRMALEGRPPVTNLYSSAVFIGWGAVGLGLILERVYRLGLGLAAAAVIGFVTLIIAHNLALGGDTMEMMRAVLDTNFWLATHVVVITLGYTASFAAGFLAIAFVLLGVFSRLLRLPVSRAEAAVAGAASPAANRLTIGQALQKMVYAIICFATLFSFAGTVLGGIWADQSWGRFWGWDPKENGALIIVLWNAAILHARWGGVIRERGLMNMAIFGNVVTAFSWFGVNMLGIGLHSYGFMDAAFKWLMMFFVSQFVLMALGALPLRFWASYRGGDAPTGGPPARPVRVPQPRPA
jgi:cytochrome c-type biogenesis protein CcsB